MLRIVLLIACLCSFLNGVSAQKSESIKCDSIFRAKIGNKVVFIMPNRKIVALVKPGNPLCETGNYFFDIEIGPSGQVLKADFDSKLSSKISDSLKFVLVEAAMKTRFDAREDAPAKQKGNLLYEFKMNTIP